MDYLWILKIYIIITKFYLSINRSTSAIKYCKKGFKFHPKNNELMLILAKAYFISESYEKSLNVIDLLEEESIESLLLKKEIYHLTNEKNEEEKIKQYLLEK